MAKAETRDQRSTMQFEDPPFAKALFGSTAWAWLWAIVRLYVGYRWLISGSGKLSNPAWTQTGEALQGYWLNAVRIPEPPARPAISFDWYRTFLEALLNGQHYVWFSKLVVAAEILIGIALVLGVFTGIAAFFGAFMNWNFMMAGTASINPVLFPLAILLVLAWKTAGWWGLDRWILPALGTPWRPGTIFRRTGASADAEPEPGRNTG
jgi:thiosulfate dehydrogenase (quinone) large subunit